MSRLMVYVEDGLTGERVTEIAEIEARDLTVSITPGGLTTSNTRAIDMRVTDSFHGLDARLVMRAGGSLIRSTFDMPPIRVKRKNYITLAPGRLRISQVGDA